MYADNNRKSLDDVEYLVDLAKKTENPIERVTVMKKASTLISAIIQETQHDIDTKVLK